MICFSTKLNETVNIVVSPPLTLVLATMVSPGKGGGPAARLLQSVVRLCRRSKDLRRISS